MSDDTYSVGALGAEPDEYLPPAGRASSDLVPVCPHCNGLVRRNLDVPVDYAQWRCDLHGVLIPRWVEP